MMRVILSLGRDGAKQRIAGQVQPSDSDGAARAVDGKVQVVDGPEPVKAFETLSMFSMLMRRPPTLRHAPASAVQDAARQ